MKLSIYTSSLRNPHTDFGVINTYRLVSFAGISSSIDLSSFQIQPDTTVSWDAGLRWSVLRAVYGLSSCKGDHFQIKALRRTLFILANRVGFSFSCKRGVGYRTTSSVVGLSFRSIFGFSRQLFNTSRALTRGLLPTSTIGFYREGAAYSRLNKTRARRWIDLRNRNFSSIRQNRDSANTVRNQMFDKTRFRTIAWWSQALHASRMSSVQYAVNRSVKTLIPIKGDVFHSIQYVSKLFKPSVMVRGLGTRYVRRINLNSNSNRIFSPMRGSFGFLQGVRNSRLRRFPNYWRKTRRVVPFKSQRNDWVFKETGYNISSSLVPKTFATGGTFDGSTAHLVFMLNTNSFINFRALNNEMVAPNYSRLNRTVQRFRASMKKVIRRDVVRQIPHQITRHFRQLIWGGFRNRPWLRYKRADVKSRVIYRRMQHIFASYAPRFRYSKLNKLYMIRQRVGIRSNQFHRRAIFFRLRRKWATNFGLNRSTGLFVSVMDGAARVIYKLLNRPTTSLMGASGYLTNAANASADRYKTGGRRFNAAARRVHLRSLAQSCIQSQGADRSLEGLMVSGFAYDIAFKRNIIEETLLNAPTQISILHAAINNKFIMSSRGIPGSARYMHSRNTGIASIGSSVWQKCRPVMYRRRLGFVDKFLAYAIVRGGSSSAVRNIPALVNSNAHAISSEVAKDSILNIKALRQLRSSCSADFMSNVFTGEFPMGFPKLLDKRISDSICEQVSLLKTQPSYLTQRPSAIERHTKWRKSILTHLRLTAGVGKKSSISYKDNIFSSTSFIYTNIQKRCLGVTTSFSDIHSTFWKLATERMAAAVRSAGSEVLETVGLAKQSHLLNKKMLTVEVSLKNIKQSVLPFTDLKLNTTKRIKKLRFNKYRSLSGIGLPARISCISNTKLPAVGGLSFWLGNSNGTYPKISNSFLTTITNYPFEVFLKAISKQYVSTKPLTRWVFRRLLTNTSVSALTFSRFRNLSKEKQDLLTFRYARGYIKPNVYGSHLIARKNFLKKFGTHIHQPNEYTVVRQFNALYKKYPLGFNPTGGILTKLISYMMLPPKLPASMNNKISDIAFTELLGQKTYCQTVDIRKTARIFRSRPQGSRKRYYNPVMHSLVGSTNTPLIGEILFENSNPNETYASALAASTIMGTTPTLLKSIGNKAPILFAERSARSLAIRERFTNYSVIPAREIAIQVCRKQRDRTLRAMRQRLARIVDQGLIKAAHEKIRQTQTYFDYKITDLETRPALLPTRYSDWVSILHCRWWGLLRADYRKQIIAAEASTKPFAEALASSPRITRLITPTLKKLVPASSENNTKTANDNTTKKISQLKAEIRARDGYFGSELTPEELKRQRNRRYQRRALRRRRHIFGKKGIRCTPEDILIELPQSSVLQSHNPAEFVDVMGENPTIALIRALEQLRARSSR